MRRTVLPLVFVAVAKATKEEFKKGAVLQGGSNGMFFDADNHLHVAQVLGTAISVLDPETGEVLKRYGPQDKVFFPDDLTIGPNGTLYWTDTFAGTVGRRLPTGESELLYDIGTYPNANPITLSDDGSRLFFAQCFNMEEGQGNGLYQLDLSTMETTTILEGIPHCASNAMDYHNGALYGPRLFEGRVVRIDRLENVLEVSATPKTAAIHDVTTQIAAPVAVKFSKKGELHVLDATNGAVYKVDLNNTKDVSSNAEIIAQLPFNGLDNLAFDANDRLFVSSWSTGEVLEVLGKEEFRVVSPGSFSATSGLAVQEDVLYASGPLELHGYDLETSEEVLFHEILMGFSELIFPTTIVAAKESNLVAVLSFVGGALTMWDLESNSALFQTSFSSPSDAHPYQDGWLVVEAATGNITYASGPELTVRETIASIPGSFFLAGNDQDVYISNAMDGTILQIIANNNVLEPPTEVSSGHAAPEGIALLDEHYLLVVASGTGTLEKVCLQTGQVKVLAEDLGFRPSLPDFGLIFGFTNDVVAHNGYAYVNADQDNVIYKISLQTDDSSDDSHSLDDEDVESMAENSGLVSWMSSAPLLVYCVFMCLRSLCSD